MRRPASETLRPSDVTDPPKRLTIVTDAWFPQINGVVRTLHRVKQELETLGKEIQVVSPDQFFNVACPTYPEIRLALFPKRKLVRILDSFQPSAIHIATEAPLGMAARRYCLKRGYAFTTSFHTRFPEYIQARFGIPTSWGYAWLRRFHRPAGGVMVATQSLKRDLASRGFRNLVDWGRGVDTELFRPQDEALFDLPRPIFICVGRVAVEKNLEAFLDLDLPGSKVVVGDGPLLETLKQRYPKVHFTGAKVGEDLARHYASADVFVFPSRTDTFGLVLLEALASGLPVAAYPVTGPLDVVNGAPVGCLDDDLGKAARAAAELSPEACRAYALRFSWSRCAAQFSNNLHILP